MKRKRKKKPQMPKYECLDYEEDIVKIKELVSNNERFCYLCRYNAQVLTAMGKHEMAKVQNDAFMGLKVFLGEERYYEIMHLADEAFYERYDI